MKAFISILFSFYVSSAIAAEEYICAADLDSNDFGVKTLHFNTDSAAATIVLSNGWSFEGKITSNRKHNDGKKINLYFEGTDIVPGYDSEYVLFSWRDSYRVFGVSYFKENGKKRLHSSAGNNSIDCEIKTI